MRWVVVVCAELGGRRRSEGRGGYAWMALRVVCSPGAVVGGSSVAYERFAWFACYASYACYACCVSCVMCCVQYVLCGYWVDHMLIIHVARCCACYLS